LDEASIIELLFEQRQELYACKALGDERVSKRLHRIDVAIGDRAIGGRNEACTDARIVHKGHLRPGFARAEQLRVGNQIAQLGFFGWRTGVICLARNLAYRAQCRFARRRNILLDIGGDIRVWLILAEGRIGLGGISFSIGSHALDHDIVG
jgi:hypothetical protein